jgi:predicted Zn-dependent protease
MNDGLIRRGILYFLCLILSACAAISPGKATIERKDLPEAKPGPRELASIQLTEQGQMLLEKNKIDEAISVLERAVSVYAYNGKNYYYLAEAWLRKGNRKQAREWNRLAEMYLAGDREWSQRVLDQRERIKTRAR